MKNLKGIFPALLTPFTKENKINEKTLERLIEYNIQKGVSGFYACGSTAEAFLLLEDERRYLLELVCSMVKGRCAVIAHIGCISTDAAIRLAKHAGDLGVDAISSIPPFYYSFRYDEIRGYYMDIVNETGLPMIIYNFPAFSGVSFTVENIAEFLRDDRFIGVKHTSNDFYMLERIKAKFPEKLVYNGYDEMFLSGISMGADGGIGSTYNFMAEKFITIQRLLGENRIDECRRVQKEVNAVIDALVKIGVMSAEKEILNMMGFDFGEARAPFKRLTDDEKDNLRSAVLPLLTI